MRPGKILIETDVHQRDTKQGCTRNIVDSGNFQMNHIKPLCTDPREMRVSEQKSLARPRSVFSDGIRITPEFARRYEPEILSLEGKALRLDTGGGRPRFGWRSRGDRRNQGIHRPPQNQFAVYLGQIHGRHLAHVGGLSTARLAFRQSLGTGFP